MKKATAIAPTNIAFIKYWGRKEEVLRLPVNGSISMNLDGLFTRTTVEFDTKYSKDEVSINGSENEKEKERVTEHLDRIRILAGLTAKAKVVSINNFPSATGLSSSASGFAALTLAAAVSAGLTLSEKDLSILARQGSGSSCRSIPSGFVQWLDGNTSESSYAKSIFPPNYWNISDVVVIVSDEKKSTSSSEGQKRIGTSPFMHTRLSLINEKIDLCKKYIEEKNFSLFGELVENEALELHAIMLTSHPALIYWLPGTIIIMKEVQRWRKGGLEVYFTINTGQDMHLICQKKDEKTVIQELKKLPQVKRIIPNIPACGTRISEEHLF